MQWFNSLVTDTLGAATDPNFANVVLLMHMDGTNGGTTFTDVKSHTTSVGSGTPTTSTSQFKFGTASLNIPTDSKVDVTVSANEFDFGTGAFTVEFWMYSGSTANDQHIIGNTDGANTGSWGILYSGGTHAFSMIGSGGSASFTLAPALSLNTWYHIAICRSGTSNRLFVDGTQNAATQTDSTNYANAVTTYAIGRCTNNARPFVGNLDDVRVTKGVARYTSNFTAPTAAFPNS